MKKLFEFTIPRTIREKVKEESTNDKGEKTTVEKEVVKTASKTVVLKKPTRGLYDEAELFYGVRLSEGIKAGLLTRALLAKRFSNDGGVMSEPDKEQYADLYIKMFELQTNIEKAGLIAEAEKTQEDKDKLTSWVREIALLREDVQDFEVSQASLFDQTAENRARTKTILWWVLHLSHFRNGQEYEQIYEGDRFEDRLSTYDELEEDEDLFWEELSRKLIYYVSFWYVGKAQTQEDFEHLLTEIDETELDEMVEESLGSEEAKESEAESKKEEPKKEEPKKEEPKKEEPKKEKSKKEESKKEESKKEESKE